MGYRVRGVGYCVSGTEVGYGARYGVRSTGYRVWCMGCAVWGMGYGVLGMSCWLLCGYDIAMILATFLRLRLCL